MPGNTIIREKIGVTSNVKKIVGSSLGWCGHDWSRFLKALRRVIRWRMV